MKAFPAALALAAALVLSACFPPTTSRPVGTTVGLKPDSALIGTWKGSSDDGKPSYFHFMQQSDGSISALLVESGPKAEDWNFVMLTTARLGASRFMNARMLLSNGKPDSDNEGAPPHGSVPVLYRIDAKGTLTLFMMDEPATKAAIRAGKIKGTIETGTMGDATITADPKALDKFLASPAGLALFVKPFFTLYKID